MAQYKFEGDVTGISDRQLEFINTVIQEQGYENSKVTFEPVGKAGDNYVAMVKRIIIEGDNGSLNMIAKIAPGNETVRQLMTSAVLFRNEHVMYSEVLPKLVQLQKDAGIPEKDQLRYAKCYGSTMEAPNEVILLEDLREINFEMLDRFKPLSNECMKSILKNFAILHSLSFALRQKEPLTYEHFKGSLLDMWALQAGAEEMKVFFQGLEQQVLEVLENPEHVSLVRHKVTDSLNLVAKLAKADLDSKYTVIVQGDAWTNNIMFKLSDDKPPESIMIDYQISKNFSPVYDVMYIIFNGTDYETRKQYFNDWLDYYHTELEKALADHNMKANFVYPRDKLDADLLRYGKLMFGLSITIANILIRKSDDAAKMMDALNSDNWTMNNPEQLEEFAVQNLDEESVNLFKDRVNGLIMSFTEFGLL